MRTLNPIPHLEKFPGPVPLQFPCLFVSKTVANFICESKTSISHSAQGMEINTHWMHPQVSQALIVILNKCLVPDRPIIVQSHYVNFNKSAISVTVKMTSDRAVSMCQPHTSQTQNHKANKHTLRNIRMLSGIKINPSPMKTTELNTQAKYRRLSKQTHTSMEIEILRKKQVIWTNYTHTPEFFWGHFKTIFGSSQKYATSVLMNHMVKPVRNDGTPVKNSPDDPFKHPPNQ